METIETGKAWSIRDIDMESWNTGTVAATEQLQQATEQQEQEAGAYVFSQGNEETKQGAATVRRDSNGRWLPGTVTGAHRPLNKTVKTIKHVIRDKYTLEELLGRLDEAYNVAKRQGSSRGMVAATLPIIEYSEGKPVQQVVIEAGRTDLLQQLLQSDKPLLPEPEPVLQIEAKVTE